MASAAQAKINLPLAPKVVNSHDAKTQFSKLLARVARGETITIAKRNRPVAQLVPMPRQRQLGLDRGQVWISDDFNDPDPELEAMFNDWPILSTPTR